MSLICIKEFPSRMEADLARGLLEVNGIEALVAADDCGGMRPHLQLGLGIRLLVGEADADQARALLAEVAGLDGEE